ncbi:MAG: hypothetical protein GAK35_02560 [Herbaspirillum frisingense]|uniref:Uncharacterized protein n=1 Tax=Herbaspirillum frisingense TaxID=92645 RepID=A0A7V8JU29_9BURK|nr:MAG: hypothetical protein GAK35_02560 [Herbaspirillum frisingense]
MRHEQLGREGQHRAAIGVAHQRAVRHRLARAQAAVQGDGVAVGVEAQAVGVVDLIGVAGGDVVPDAGDGGAEAGFVRAGRDMRDAGGRFRAGLPRQPGLDLRRREPLAALEQHDARQRAAGVLVRQALQRCAQFIRPQGHGLAARGQLLLHLRQQRRETRRVVAGQRAQMPGVQARTRFGRGGEVVVEEGEAVGHGAAGRAGCRRGQAGRAGGARQHHSVKGILVGLPGGSCRGALHNILPTSRCPFHAPSSSP